MATCTNCGAQLSCGCQKRKASDGKQVCAMCINRYESNATQKIIRPLATARPAVPQHSWGPNRYKKT